MARATPPASVDLACQGRQGSRADAAGRVHRRELARWCGCLHRTDGRRWRRGEGDEHEGIGKEEKAGQRQGRPEATSCKRYSYQPMSRWWQSKRRRKFKRCREERCHNAVRLAALFRVEQWEWPRQVDAGPRVHFVWVAWPSLEGLPAKEEKLINHHGCSKLAGLLVTWALGSSSLSTIGMRSDGSGSKAQRGSTPLVTWGGRQRQRQGQRRRAGASHRCEGAAHV